VRIRRESITAYSRRQQAVRVIPATKRPAHQHIRGRCSRLFKGADSHVTGLWMRVLDAGLGVRKP
jgi:hypothetical protein